MSTAMHEQPISEHNPALLRPGTFIYLWAPGQQRGDDDRVLARVERATVDTIVGEDLAEPDPAQRRHNYGVGDVFPPSLRWTWEVAAPPRRSTILVDGIERVEGSALTLEERIRLVCGSPGAKITVRLKSGEAFPGVMLSKVIMGRDDDWESEWVVFAAPADSLGPLAHVFRTDQIAGFSRDADA